MSRPLACRGKAAGGTAEFKGEFESLLGCHALVEADEVVMEVLDGHLLHLTQVD